jgi:hypothetical protein
MGGINIVVIGWEVHAILYDIVDVVFMMDHEVLQHVKLEFKVEYFSFSPITQVRFQVVFNPNC